MIRSATCFAILTACAASQETAAPRASAPSTRLGSAKVARDFGLKHELVSITFGQNANGTTLLLELLARANQRGVRWVTDVEFVFQQTAADGRVECRAPVQWDGEAGPTAPPVDTAVPQAEFATDLDQYPVVSHQVLAREHELVCQRRLEQVIVKGAPPPTEGRQEAAKLREVDDCHLVPVERRVTRWDFMLINKFVPVNYELVGKRYSEERLREGRPICYRVGPGQERPNRIQARFTWRGRHGDDRLPTPPIRDVEILPEH